MSALIRKAKRIIKIIVGKDYFTKVDVKCDKERFGSRFGGWEIISSNLNNNSIIYSFGIGEDISFDLAILDRFDLCIHAFDPTPKSIQWVKQQKVPDNFILHDYGLAHYDGEIFFYPPENSSHISHTVLPRPNTEHKKIVVPVKKLETIFNELGHTHIDILKMDIEGAEYPVVEDFKNHNIRPNQILIEFHHRFPGVGLSKTKDAVRELRSLGYKLFSVSESGEEYSFLYNA